MMTTSEGHDSTRGEGAMPRPVVINAEHQITIRVSGDQRDRLDETATDLGVSRSAITRALIAECLNDPRVRARIAVEVMEGMVPAVPSDLVPVPRPDLN
jgi:predicted transcriptional regulator